MSRMSIKQLSTVQQWRSWSVYILKVALILSCSCSYPFHVQRGVYAFTSHPISHRAVSQYLKSTRVGFKQPLPNHELAGADVISENSLTTDTRREISLNRLKRHSNTDTKSTVEQVLLSPELFEKEHANYLPDTYQHETVRSDAPAILLESGPGTGKTTVLASRIAYLLRTKQALPQNMVVLSFTKRDANALKDKALNMLFDGQHDHEARKDCDKMLWSGTIHSFAKKILEVCDNHTNSHTPLRIISTREMRSRVKQCLGQLPPESFHLFKKALDQSNQRVATLISDIMRCIDLWQEAGAISTPFNHSPNLFDDRITDKRQLDDINKVARDTNIELAMRLGIPCNVATIALEISGNYQTLHASTGTTDPSNVAGLAYHHLLTKPEELSKVRSKLDHVILDEYQDVSVSQHKLLRLLIRGVTEERDSSKRPGQSSSGKASSKNARLPILTERKATWARNGGRDIPCFHVPKLMCAGDINQSIYGWRGAAPSLTVDGFHEDFPQGVLVPLNTCYRLPFQILNAANVLMSDSNPVESSNQQSFDISPAAARATAEQARGTSQFLAKDVFSMNNFSLGKKLLIEDALMSESRSSVFIKGLWDMREEAKFVASEIRKRSKERMTSCAAALRKLCVSYDEGNSRDEPSTLVDSTDVAIMLRTSGATKLFEEALIKKGIPYITSSAVDIDAKSDSESTMNGQGQRQRHSRAQDSTLLAMKPVHIITMHSAKGQEFDDVYLAGWTEGVFPHSSSVPNNRLHEERRIAYVALTRARQRVLVTYSFVRSVAHFGPRGERKDVTEQVKPSRFLFDLLSKTPISDNLVGSSCEASKKPKIQQAAIQWDNSVGFKEIVAGKDLPSYFAKSYRAPPNFRLKGPLSVPSSTEMYSSHSKEHAKEPKNTKPQCHTVAEPIEQKASTPLSAPSSTEIFSSHSKEQAKEPNNPKPHCHTVVEPTEQTASMHLLAKVTSGLNEIFCGKRGIMARKRVDFLSTMKEYGIGRGTAVVLKHNVNTPDDKSMDALICTPDEDLTTRAISKCTARQLGLYLYYLLSHNKMQTNRQTNLKQGHLTSMEPVDKEVSLHHLEKVTSGLHEVFSEKRGVMGRQRVVFLSILKEYGIRRGTAVVLKHDVHPPGDKAMDALICTPDEDLTTRAISKCTARQLGLYLYYLLTNCEQ